MTLTVVVEKVNESLLKVVFYDGEKDRETIKHFLNTTAQGIINEADKFGAKEVVYAGTAKELLLEIEKIK